MNLSKSIDFLLENAGAVIQYRLRKEILKNISQAEEEKILKQIYQTPHFKLIEGYIKPNGIIGGLTIPDKDKHTRLQDCEAVARLLSNYAIPKNHPYVENFVAALRNDDVLYDELSGWKYEGGYEGRFNSINNGNATMAVIYAMQAMMGYGDDYDDLRDFQEICLKGFRHVLEVSSLDEIVKKNPKIRKSTPYIESDEYFPNMYTLAMLAYTHNWRTPENVKMLADFWNHLDAIAEHGNLIGGVSRLVNGKLHCTSCAFTSPITPFSPENITTIVYRRLLTEISMLGASDSVDVINKSVFSVENSLDDDGVLRLRFDLPHNKHYSPRYIEYPTKYVDTRLEPYYQPRVKNPVGLLCDLTFWAVQFLHYTKMEN